MISTADAIFLAASAVTVGVLVAAVRLAGFRGGGARVDAQSFAEALAALEPGVAIAALARDARGRAGVALLRDGRIALCRAMGDRLACRIAPAREVEARRRPRRGDWRVGLADVGFPPLALAFEGEPPDFLPTLSRKTT